MYEFAVTPAITQLRRPGVTITEVAQGSLGEELELAANDRIVKVNGRTVRDYLDFRFQTGGETDLTFQVRKPSGELIEIEFDRDESEDLGLMFEQIVPRQCANECIFCFCKGNPDDARPSLFVRDEDIRLSFLYGNYTTLTSITEDEMKRVIEQRLSPQYVSVHATDLKTRAYLLGVDEKRADISGKLQRLLDNDIEVHAQVVLCPGINDGAVLDKTLRDLAAHYPRVISAAVVPVALTRYNTDERLERVTPEFCRDTIKQVEKLQKEFRKTLGTTFAFLGDEIYIKAGAEIPSRRHYGSYPQIEDGVGMVRSFVNAFEKLLSKPLSVDVGVGTVVTGEMFAPLLATEIAKFNELTGSRLSVLGVPNTYFSGDVSVAGLLSGQDLVAVRDQITGEFVIVPSHIIKSDEPIMIDGMRFDELQQNFDVPVWPLDTKGLMRFLSGEALVSLSSIYEWQNNPRHAALIQHPAKG